MCQRKHDLYISNLSVPPRPQAYDLTFISPHSEPYARDGGRHPSWAADNAEKAKKRRYGRPSEENEIDFHPMAMVLYGRIGSAFERGIHPLISLTAQRRGTSPAQERSKLLTRFVSRVLQLTAGRNEQTSD